MPSMRYSVGLGSRDEPVSSASDAGRSAATSASSTEIARRVAGTLSSLRGTHRSLSESGTNPAQDMRDFRRSTEGNPMTDIAEVKRLAVAGKQRMTPSEAFVETLVAQGVQ